MLKFGELLKKVRLERKLTQKALANALNLDQSSISHYESERKLPDINTMLRMANYLDYPFEDLINARNYTTHGSLSDNLIVMDRETHKAIHNSNHQSPDRMVQESSSPYDTKQEETQEKHFNEEILRKIPWELDGQIVTPEEIEQAIRYVKFLRNEKQNKN